MGRFRLSLSALILIGFFLGIFSGVFFGELCSVFEPLGRAYLMLLRMSVLPYIIVSLTCGIGSLDYKSMRGIAVKGITLLLSFWMLTISVLFVLQYAFPNVDKASFYSSAIGKIPDKIDYLRTYIPDNPFYALSANLIPAVVLFSICFGVALIGIPGKKHLLDSLQVISKTLIKITSGIVKFSPLGVFALTANAAGTISLEKLSYLQIYFACFLVAALLLGLWTLPRLLVSLTPIRYGVFFKFLRASCLLAFTTVSIFAVIPAIIEGCKKVLREYSDDEKTPGLVDVWVPISFKFPSSAMLFPMLFILFIGWFYDHTFGFFEHMNLALSGVMSLFGSPINAIIFLLDQMRLPADAIELYTVTTVVTQRFQVFLGAVGLAVFSLLGACFVSGLLKVRWHKLLVTLGVTASVLVLSIVGIRVWLGDLIDEGFVERHILTSMTVDRKVPEKVYHTAEEAMTARDKIVQDNAWKRISSGGVLRIGYNRNAMPFAYFNKKGELVGYDIAVAHELAESLGCSLEFIPFEYQNIVRDIGWGVYDVAMSSISITEGRLEYLNFSDPYLELRMALVVEDYLREDFYKVKNILKMDYLKIASIKGSAYISVFKENIPNAKIVEINSIEGFFNDDRATALMTTAEQGTCWTLLYPSYAIAIPEPHIHNDYLGYPVAGNQERLLEYINQWLRIQKLQGFMGKQYDKWVLGKTPEFKKQRWSIIRDVLHWIK
jgi:Na+/H+-dicarboxylate symporter/ABC-type amino acid transport substrate-binding protein